MNVKRYFAPSAREALRALKEELGPDAIVLSNRAVEGGVEILALPPDEIDVLHHQPARAIRSFQPAPSQSSHSRLDDDDFHVNLSVLAAAAKPVSAAKPVERHSRSSVTIEPFNPPRIEIDDYRAHLREQHGSTGRTGIEQSHSFECVEKKAPKTVEKPPRAAAVVKVDTVGEARVQALQEANTKLMEELSGIRGMIERQLASFAWGETQRHAPIRAAVVGELLEAGFSAQMARHLGEAILEEASPEEARLAVKGTLSRLLNVRSSDTDIIDQGGVYALVGPTGVGKTTTTAKLAARCVVRHGASKLALITTDGYRIGAQEQLRIYGRILGVPVFSVRDAADLRQTLAELGSKHMVLIDTVGMSQRDRAVAEQAAMLMSAGNVHRLLLLNATCRGDTLDDVVGAYSGADLRGCIFTKVDEAASLAPVIDTAVRRRLDVFYVANGQRVPEDLHLPNRAYLLHRALRESAAESPWRLDKDDVALMLSAGGR